MFIKRLASAVLIFAAASSVPAAPPSPNGIELPAGVRNWRLIAVSQRTENGTLRAILGNSVAIDAARAGQTNPWPPGTLLAKLVWKAKAHESFPTAMVPGEFVHLDIMSKDPDKYAATGGWGFARWLGERQEPYGADPSFAQECLGCHQAAQDHDRVFTVPVRLPE